MGGRYPDTQPTQASKLNRMIENPQGVVLKLKVDTNACGMKLKRIPSDISLARLEREYANSRNFMIRLPNVDRLKLKSISKKNSSVIIKMCRFLHHLSSINPKNRTLVILGPIHLLPYAYHTLNENYNFKNLIAIRLSKPIASTIFLPNEHFGAAIFTTDRNKTMNDVRKPYQHCKYCGNTVKDYGGKRHLMEMQGARITDVWTDITMHQDTAFPSAVVRRLFDMIRSDDSVLHAYSFSAESICSEHSTLNSAIMNKIMPNTNTTTRLRKKARLNKIYNSDVLEGFKKISDGVVDFALVDPPYNVSVKYGAFADNLDDTVYLDWCKKWVDEVARTLKEGGIFATVNIPRWTLELFPYMQQKFTFQSWIVWDALSYPRSRVISAHYPILCFSKGSAKSTQFVKHLLHSKEHADVLSPINFGYCIRSTCVNKRTPKAMSDRKPLSDLWTDVHRIRHNTFRYSHPTLMPQRLARRLILLCSKGGDTILDCFNGVGTTTLVASSLDRKFLGIEKNREYYKTSIRRHAILNAGGDPFTREAAQSTSTAKGYRKKKIQNQVPKRNLQMEVKRIAEMLGRCPSEHELGRIGKYPLKVYFDNFEDWAEITVATRRTGIDKKVSGNI